MIGWLATLAEARGPGPELALGGAGGFEAAGAWGGLSLAAGYAAGRWGLELEGRSGPGAGSAVALGRIRGRAVLLASRGVALSAVAGFGVERGARAGAIGTAGLDARYGSGPVRPFGELEAGLGRGRSPGRLLVTLGFTVRRPPARPAAPEAGAGAEAPPPPLPPPIEHAMIWVPPPVCEWLEPRPADRSRAEAHLAAEPVWILNDPVVADPRADPLAPRPPPDPLATVTVAAEPGDRITADGEPLAVAEDGVGSRRMSPGPVQLTVEGGGRLETIPVQLAAGATLWVAATPPGPITVPFPLGSSALSPEALARLAEISAHLGGWRLEVIGGHSAEGDPGLNEALAAARAQGVRDALIADGVPPDRLVAPDGVDSERTAIVRPVRP